MQSRTISGSFVAWRISGGVKTFPEQGAWFLLVGARPSMASERCDAHRILPSASPQQEHVRPLAERAQRAGFLARRRAQAEQETARASVREQAQEGGPGVLGNARRGAELERRERQGL